jgi:hypothetical protein
MQYKHTATFTGSSAAVGNGTFNIVLTNDSIASFSGATTAKEAAALLGAHVYKGEQDLGTITRVYETLTLIGGVETLVLAFDVAGDSITATTELVDVITIVNNENTDAFATLTNLQEIAELGNNAPEKVDVTVLSDAEKKSIDGLVDTAQDLAFKFLYEKEQFVKLAALEGVKEWRVTLPDGETATFTATPSVKLANAGVSAALSYTLTLSVNSKIVFA